MLAAANFLQFCKGGATQCMKITWPELDAIQTETPLIKLPDLPESVFQDILEKRGDHAAVSQLFPSAFQEFLDDCYSQEHLRRVTDADVDKFLKGKPDLSHEDIKARLPEWLQDKMTGFLPHLANELPPRRSWDHTIELIPGKEPPYQKNRPLSPRELLVVRKWLDDNLTKGFIRESRARCAAPLLLAAKPGGGVRICQDYRGLNSVTIKNRYPLPLIRETLDALCHAKYYTKLDVIAAFNKLRIAEGHEWKTAFITRFGLFESLVMPFGLCNAPASFQHYINHTLYDQLDKICTAYLDDVLVYSQTRKEHRQHVREVIDRLIEAGLQIDINKCEFETTKTKYLGLIIASDGIQMDPDKVATVTGWEKPANVRELQRFLGFANFYRRFIRDFSSICRPLNDLLRKESAWCWAERQQHAFMQLKTAFTTGPALAFFDYNRKTVLETDASDWASGGVLSQYDDDGSLRPVAYFSSKHSAAECNYEIYDKELLAIIKALEEWRPELQGNASEFEIMTDHKNLEYFTTTKVLNQRQVRWSEFLSQFNFRIIYRPGSKAVRPDARKLEATGYRFAEVHQVAGSIRSSMRIESVEFESRLHLMSVQKGRDVELGSGVHLSMFVVRARLDRSGFDVIVRKAARNILPTAPMPIARLQLWHRQLLNRYHGTTVAALTRKLGSMDHESVQETVFASELRRAISHLLQSLGDGCFNEATLLPREVCVPSFAHDNPGRPSTRTLLAFGLVLPVHATVHSTQCEFTPLRFLKLRQHTYDGSPYQAEFSQTLHHDLSRRLRNDIVRRDITAPTARTSMTTSSISRALDRRKKQRTLLDMVDLDTHRPKDQALMNAFISFFELLRFQHLLTRWVACDNIPFHKLESPYFRDLMAYANSVIADSGSIPTHSTIREWIVRSFNRHKGVVAELLCRSLSRINVSFDAWSSRKFMSLLGLTVHG
ncbi:reverse transcriptase [Purpureocillium lavendulum]|uniref:Reverse transcriptase n=1 Tax=Purpureocillium lavendulum TaxID=1247861 RepID=A0AB34FDH5_9HYPO|nr:reverse transcriptase [Purpureocillium lavendulum]